MASLTKDIYKAAETLQNGEVIAIPTETVYGLAGNIYDPSAIEDIFRIKQRPHFNPLIVHIHSFEQLNDVAAQLPSKAHTLAAHFWPGPLTLVLPKKSTVPEVITAGKSTVAVRMPNHPLLLKLLKALPFPLAAPSANPFNRISPTTAQHVQDYFEKEIQLILDGGACQQGIESTIVGFEDEIPIIYRLGALSVEEIEAIVGTVIINNQQEALPEAPGMLKKHYAPKTKTILVDDLDTFINSNAQLRLAVLSFFKQVKGENVLLKEQLSAKKDLEEAAANLYAALHRMDASNADLIVVERLPNAGLGKSINDRLQRAADHSQKTPDGEGA